MPGGELGTIDINVVVNPETAALHHSCDFRSCYEQCDSNASVVDLNNLTVLLHYLLFRQSVLSI